MSADVLFIGADAGGNLPPITAVARELVSRGHRVTFAGFVPHGVDAEHVALPAVTGHEPGPAHGAAAQLARMTQMSMSPALAHQVRELIARRRPDVVAVDGMMIGSMRAAERSRTPVAALFHSFGALWGGAVARGPANTAMRPFGLSPVQTWSAADARLLLTDRVLDPLREADDPVGFEWTGTTEHGVASAPRRQGAHPLVLVSLSTVWQSRQDDVYRRIITALGELPVHAIVTRSSPLAPFEGRLPRNVELRGRMPHSEILPKASLVVGHGGHSTTLAALAHGVPLLVLPMNRTSDQPMIGRIVESNGLGGALPKSSSAEAIRNAARDILGDGAIAARAARVGERLRGQDGARVAADRIEALAGG